jgi:hypothetical protein
LSFSRDFLRIGAPHPGRRARGRPVLFRRRLELVRRHPARWGRRRIAAPCGREWIVLTNQASELGERVGLGPRVLIAAAA